MNLEFLKDNLIIIIPSNAKRNFLKILNKKNQLYNIKILTFNELLKDLFFDYKKEAVTYIIKKYNISFNNAKEHLNNMLYLTEEKYDNTKLNNLNLIKKELMEAGYLIKNDSFTYNISQKEVVFYGFHQLSKWQKKVIEILKKYTNVEIISPKTNEFSPKIFEFATLNEEIEYIANDIIEKKLDLNNTFIAGINNDNISTIRRIFKNYNINLNINHKISLFNNIEGQNFLKTFNLSKIKDIEIKNTIIKMLNQYHFVNDDYLLKEILTEEFKKTYIPVIKYDNAVNEIEIIDNIINEESNIYVINFNNEYIPQKFKDTDLINDLEKPNYLDNTNDKNNLLKEKWIIYLKNIKNLTITYCNQNLNGILNPSSLIDDYNLCVIKKHYEHSIFSHKSNLYNLGLLLDKMQKTKTKDPSLDILLATYPTHQHNTYNNQYKRFNSKLNYLNLSYSKMNTFYECPFKYYCNYILKIGEYKSTFDAYLGSLCHFILSKIYDDNFNFENAKNDFLKSEKYDLTNENIVFMNKILNELKESISQIKQLTNLNKYQDISCEEEIKININGTNFIGIIDKILKYNNNVAIIDYKTGNVEIDLRLAEYGLNLQLPTYLYLIKNLYKDSNITGFYLQHIIKPLINKDFEKSFEEISDNHLKLEGYTNADENIIIDFDPTYQNSSFVKSLKMTKNGFSKYSKVLSNTEINKLYTLTDNKIKECINNIHDFNFKIEPKKMGTTDLSCEFCEFKSICFKTEKDEVFLNTKEEGDNND